MRPNLIARLKEEWNNLDPVDPLRGLIADAIDALAYAAGAELRHLHAANQKLTGEVAALSANAFDDYKAKHELLGALQDLLMDTQHKDHDCGDGKWCPVINARNIALKYDKEFK